VYMYVCALVWKCVLRFQLLLGLVMSCPRSCTMQCASSDVHCACVYACMCVFVHVCKCMCMCVCTHVYKCMGVCAHVCKCVLCCLILLGDILFNVPDHVPHSAPTHCSLCVHVCM
jgi:hypothetical protein